MAARPVESIYAQFMVALSETPAAFFRFDGAQGELSAGTDVVRVPPKSIDLLRFLVKNVGRVVTREEIVGAVWGGLAVSADAVRHTVRQLRKALGDPVGAPRFVETVARRGWRFIGTAVPVAPEIWILEPAGFEAKAGRLRSRGHAPLLVGRDLENAVLDESLARAVAGERQFVLIKGEAGIGKTRLVQSFLARAETDARAVVARGDCVEHVGPGMPHWPILEFLEEACRAFGGQLPLAMMRRHAPHWLAELPGLAPSTGGASDETAEAAESATPARMIRELGEVLDRLSEGRVLVLWIEDLQWSDRATLDALRFLVRRRESGKVLLIATLRNHDAPEAVREFERQMTEQSTEGRLRVLTPRGLTAGDLTDYLANRFGPDSEPARSGTLVSSLLASGAANPLFLVSLVDEGVDQGLLKEENGAWRVSAGVEISSAPESLQPVLARQIESLDATYQEVLEAASVVGMEFSILELAAVLEGGVEELESRVDRLVEDGRFVVSRGAMAWPDGSLSSAYRFAHALHRDVLISRMSAGRRSRLHRTIAERKASAYAGREEEVAAELAMHFERGLAPEQALSFYALAGEANAQRFANQEAVMHFRKALEIVAGRPAAEVGLAEIRVRLGLCAPLAAVAGYGAPELEANLSRLEEMTRSIEDSPEMFPVLLGLWSLHLIQGDLERTGAFADRLLALEQREGSAMVRLQANRSAGHVLFFQGRVNEAEAHFARALEGYDIASHQRLDYSIGDDPLVLVLAFRCWSDWFGGDLDRAVEDARKAVLWGERLAHPQSLAFALSYGAVLHQLRGDVARAWEWSDRALEVATADGMTLWIALGQIVRGWTRAKEGESEAGILLIREGIEAWTETGSELGLPHFLCILAESLRDAGELNEALALMETVDGLIEKTGQSVFKCEAQCLRGQLLFDRHESEADQAEAGRLFEAARMTAREQQIPSLELRTALAAAPWHERSGNGDVARAWVAEGLDRVRGGNDDPDRRRARERLASGS